QGRLAPGNALGSHRATDTIEAGLPKSPVKPVLAGSTYPSVQPPYRFAGPGDMAARMAPNETPSQVGVARACAAYPSTRRFSCQSKHRVGSTQETPPGR